MTDNRLSGRLAELAQQTGVPGAVLGVWADGKLSVTPYGMVGRSDPAEEWFPVTFGTLPDGRAQVTYSGRIAPRV